MNKTIDKRIGIDGITVGCLMVIANKKLDYSCKKAHLANE